MKQATFNATPHRHHPRAPSPNYSAPVGNDPVGYQCFVSIHP